MLGSIVRLPPSLRFLGGWGVTAAAMPEEEEGPGSMEVIWTTARSLDPTGRYRRPFGGAGTGNASSASSIPPFSIIRVSRKEVAVVEATAVVV
uniref:Uncharacterized protein n=1 Tax=Arundo donax TaxID=35708 RepID=A0A0A8XST6_ARUDO